MTKVKISVWLPPATIYQHVARQAQGYAPSERSRFAAIRDAADQPWRLVHRRSGCSVGSLLPTLSRRITLAELLSVCASFDAATHLDWAPFDELPEAQPGSKGYPALSPAGVALAPELRSLAASAVA